MYTTPHTSVKGIRLLRNPSFLFFFPMLLFSFCLHAQVHFVDMVYDGENTYFLNHPIAMDFSPDGQFAYSLSYEDNALLVFSRNAENGELTLLEEYVDNRNGIDGLEGARDIILSADGLQVYVVAALEACITVFDRNVVTGTLSLNNIYRNHTDGIEGLEEVTSLLLSSDGKYLYAAGAADNAIVFFERNTSNGELTYLHTFSEGAESITGLQYPVDLLLSKNGEFLYATCYSGNSLVIFNRNPDTGELTYARTFYDGINGIDGLEGALSSCLSPNGQFLYIVGKWDNAVALFGPSISEGGLSYIGVSSNAINAAGGLKGAVKIAITGDSKYILINNADDNAVCLFARHPITGDLIYVTTFSEGEGGLEILSYPAAIAESPDHKQVYIGSFWGRSISIFTHDLQSQDFFYSNSFNDRDEGVKNMGGMSAVLLSPDGDHAYATSMDDHALVGFQRNTNNGQLTFDRSYKNGEGNISGLSGAKSLVISPDGRHIYVAGFYDNAIVTFTRDATSGVLTYNGKMTNSNNLNSILGPSDLMITADGKYLYVTAFWDHSILYFSRNTSTGMLSYIGKVMDGEAGVEGLAQTSSLVLSPDENYLYVTSTSVDALVVFKRSFTNGELTYVETHRNQQAGVGGLDGACTAVISPDGNYLYAAGANGSGLAWFARNTTTGRLTFKEHLQNSVFQNELKGIGDLAINASGEVLYATSKTDDYLVKFSRNPSTGILTAEALLKDDVDGVNGLGGASKLELSEDGQFIYVAGFKDDSIGVFGE